MIVFYHSTSLAPVHIVTIYAEDYLKFIESTPQQWPHFVIPNAQLRPEEIEILPGPTWRRRQPMPVVAPMQINVGANFVISGVPSGAEIYLNGASCGTADGSEIDMELGVAGFYRLRFECSGYITKEITIEAIS